MWVRPEPPSGWKPRFAPISTRTTIDTHNEPDATTKTRMLSGRVDDAGVYVSEKQAIDFDGDLDMA
jgi:hypothetical protein